MVLFELASRKNLFICLVLALAVILSSCSGLTEDDFPFVSCAGLGDTTVLGDGSWLCLREVELAPDPEGSSVPIGTEDETCFVATESREYRTLNDFGTLSVFSSGPLGPILAGGDLTPFEVGDILTSEVFNYQYKKNTHLFKNWLNVNVGFEPEIQRTGTDPILDFLTEEFFGSGPQSSCTTTYSIPVDDLRERNGGPMSNLARVNKLERHMSGEGTEYDPASRSDAIIPLMIQCNEELEGVLVLQARGEAVESADHQRDIYLCQDGQWLNEEELVSNFDSDGDSVPELFDMDCSADDSSTFADVSPLGFLAFESEGPSAVCGDAGDNFCSESSFYGWEYFSRYSYYDGVFDSAQAGEGTNSCDTSINACNNNCLWNGNSCDHIALNDQDLSSTVTFGMCCGARGADDLGRIIEYEGEEYTCLNNQLVPQGFTEPSSELQAQGDCQGAWCWVRADQDAFEVKTITRLTEPAYDLVSNGDEWLACSATQQGPIENTEFLTEEDIANRFYCYQEGSQWSWAECSEAAAGNTVNQNTVKLREAGDGLFKLPLERQAADRYLTTLDSLSSVEQDYDDLYTIAGTKTETLDFVGYDHLEFFVEFDSEPVYLPEGVRMLVKGLAIDTATGDEVVYFDQNVLGYAINAPRILEGGKQIHVKVPIGPWVDVNEIIFETLSERNSFTIHNLYLSSESQELAFCSGFDSRVTDSWLESLDEADAESVVTGEQICKAHYGDDAWFGNAAFNEVEINAAMCCGNSEAEYYSGESVNGAGCWNSEVVQAGDTAMNVEYTVEYLTQTHDVQVDQELSFNYVSLYSPTTIGIPSVGTISYGESPKILDRMTIDLAQEFASSSELEYGFAFDPFTFPGIELYLFTPHNQLRYRGQEFSIAPGAELPNNFELWLVAEQREVSSLVSEDRVSESFTFACLEEECVYALPGLPPYQLTNDHPYLYELYYVTGTNPGDEVLISQEGQVMEELANLRVRRLSQQVLFDDNNFYGCNVADYIDATGQIDENYAHCAVQGDYYCAFQEGSLVSSWSQEGLSEIGYDTSVSIVDGQEDAELTLRTVSIPANELNQSSSSVPGRNVLSNADFSRSSSRDILDWQLRDGSGALVADERSFVDEDSFTISTGFTLRSKAIAVEAGTEFSFSQGGSCSVLAYEIDSNGDESLLDVSSSFFISEDVSQVLFEFGSTGECELTEPHFERIDTFGASEEFSYDPTYPSRRAAACCTANSCWNGYVCVEEMSSLTYLSEESAGRDYRCIQGEWTATEPKMDWNNEQQGFCAQESQCFVTSSLSQGASADASASDFYDGSFPLCIDDGQYILDHYCDNGQWTSRTKFLASTLVDFVGSDEFVLSCDALDHNLPVYDQPGYNYANYLLGSDSVSSQGSASTLLGSEQQETATVCFPALADSETGRRLVNQDENTCINAVCVLEYERGSDFATAFATSMNHPARSEESFLIPLGVELSQVQNFCEAATMSPEEFTRCSEQLWFAENLNALVYAKQGIELNPGIVESIFDWLDSLFDSSSSATEFIGSIHNANRVYLLDKSGKQVRAAAERLGPQETAVVQYTGFETPVCEYVDNVADEYRLEYRWPAEPLDLVECRVEDSQQTVEIASSVDFWWPQLTGSLRVGE